ncbi:peroxiredoxin Q/BCP [Rhodobacter aestuarii]|uniref:thioredoxin-dependent peroxiredoxin n=1 Tax=Rhodobacter aestuarii TaxID=453582 RepID=A0A1N7J753_9RHOB|nr:peroxiredoxin [Rhodobacter aestuarii]PTV97107.1 peroxiredoxin Q/BCP [Rhodobacter aestuarii]SIS45198.1 peroxiredoxin Q/BCP [Rhodobacter aestuarii]
MIAIGENAPDFTLPLTETGAETGELTLSALRPRKVVLYFYPKDDTPGCTTEALDFTRLGADFDAAGALVVGISKDSPKAHAKFCAKHSLGVKLVSDETGATCEAYGTWVEKKMYGKTSMGIQRATFLIDSEGVVAQVWPKVSVKGHAEAVLEAVRAMG